jgi:hypothetical protein
MLRRVLARLGRAFDLARSFDLRDRHPDRMISASIVLYVGLGIVTAATLWTRWWAAYPSACCGSMPPCLARHLG